MAKFQCLRSGNFVSFTSPDDIRQMRVHEGYKEIFDEKENRQETAKEMLNPQNMMVIHTAKRRGRPARTVN